MTGMFLVAIGIAIVGALTYIVKPKPGSALQAFFDFFYGFGSFQQFKEALVPNSNALARPGSFRQFKLGKRQFITNDDKVMRLMFKLPNSQTQLGVAPGRHVRVRAKIDGVLVERRYTPVSADNQGYFDIIVKIKEGGVMSRYLSALKYGDVVDFSGPYGNLEYKGRGSFVIEGKPLKAGKIAMVAGGSGLTAMLSIMRMVLRDPSDTTEISLIYANKTEEDIIIHGKLEQFQESHPNFKVHFVLDQLPGRARLTRSDAARQTFSNYSTGYVSPRIMKQHLPEVSMDCVLLICGPEQMARSVEMHADILGYPKQRVYTFDC
eukprot:TRINITY_DN3932_c0_g1_i1.p1 TRINITY_DN3932_c0_g1~~TRINITY_DN3932_c0_g1_i1.p1  ORF type:complete len:321 (+),score=69.54 TRINITY_DN3932_c0_g1_i1:1060-2022(+)